MTRGLGTSEPQAEWHSRTRWQAVRIGLLLVAIWALALAVLGWSSLLAIDRYERHADEQVEQRTRLVALMHATLGDSELDAVDRDLRVIGGLLVHRLGEPPARIARAMESSLDANTLVRDLWLLDQRGKRLGNRLGVDEAFLSRPISNDKTRLVAMSRALLDVAGTFRGAADGIRLATSSW
ncbi:MAG: hypothetical protein ACOCPR_05980 [Guyparkeria sp.]